MPSMKQVKSGDGGWERNRNLTYLGRPPNVKFRSQHPPCPGGWLYSVPAVLSYNFSPRASLPSLMCNGRRCARAPEGSGGPPHLGGANPPPLPAREGTPAKRRKAIEPDRRQDQASRHHAREGRCRVQSWRGPATRPETRHAPSSAGPPAPPKPHDAAQAGPVRTATAGPGGGARREVGQPP